MLSTTPALELRVMLTRQQHLCILPDHEAGCLAWCCGRDGMMDLPVGHTDGRLSPHIRNERFLWWYVDVKAAVYLFTDVGMMQRLLEHISMVSTRNGVTSVLPCTLADRPW